MTIQPLELEKLEFEKQQHKDFLNLRTAQIELEREKNGSYSTAAVALIGSLVALLSASVTALLGGMSELAIQRIKVEAEKDRLMQQQRFEIIIQATSGLSSDVAAENLLFFVNAGILIDKDGAIKRLATLGNAPEFPQLDLQLYNSVPSPHEQELTAFFKASVLPSAKVVALEPGVRLNLRVAPKRNAPVAGVLTSNQIVKVLSLLEGWAEIEIEAIQLFDKHGLDSIEKTQTNEKVRGWVMSQYLSKPFVE
jgi:hypothetical protein